MRLLCIDSGNTSTKFGFFEKGKLVDKQTVLNDHLESAMPSLSSVDGLAVSSVGQGTSFLKDWAAFHDGLFLSANTALPFTIDYKTPQTLGADRLALTAGAFGQFPSEDVVIVDTGTCITFDLLLASGCYKGGSIHPGIDLRFRAMHQFTHALPNLERKQEPSVIQTGQTTEESMLAGVYTAILHEFDGMVNAYKQQFPLIKVIVTGGYTNFFVQHAKSKIFAVADLALFGLHEIYSYQKIK